MLTPGTKVTIMARGLDGLSTAPSGLLGWLLHFQALEIRIVFYQGTRSLLTYLSPMRPENAHFDHLLEGARLMYREPSNEIVYLRRSKAGTISPSKGIPNYGARHSTDYWPCDKAGQLFASTSDAMRLSTCKEAFL